MPRTLQPSIRLVECPRAVAAAPVLRLDQQLQDIKVRPFEARTEPVPNILWKLPNLGNQPPQDVAREDDRRRFRCPQIFVADARGAGDDFGNVLRAVWDFRWHHSCSDFKVKKEKRKSESVNGRGKRVKGIQGVLETRNPMP